MSVWEIILVYVVAPALIVAVLAMLTVGIGHHRAKVRYEPGSAWDHGDRLWTGTRPVLSAARADRVGTTWGGSYAAW